MLYWISLMLLVWTRYGTYVDDDCFDIHDYDDDIDGDTDDEEERQRLLLQILELISNAEGHRLFIRNLVKSKEDKTPCLLQRLCSNYYNFKLSKNGKIQELMKQYSEFSRESSVELNEAISGQRCHERFKCQF